MNYKEKPTTPRDIDVFLDRSVDNLALVIEQGINPDLFLDEAFLKRLKEAHETIRKLYIDYSIKKNKNRGGI